MYGVSKMGEDVSEMIVEVSEISDGEAVAVRVGFVLVIMLVLVVREIRKLRVRGMRSFIFA